MKMTRVYGVEGESVLTLDGRRKMVYRNYKTTDNESCREYCTRDESVEIRMTDRVQ